MYVIMYVQYVCMYYIGINKNQLRYGLCFQMGPYTHMYISLYNISMQFCTLLTYLPHPSR